MFTVILLIVALASPFACLGEKAATTTLTGIHVSFKLDPRLTSGVYGGERWVSPPTYVGASAQDTVEARAFGTDARGNLIRIIPEWVPSDPEMVTVSPTQGDEVKITVKRAGQSSVKVSSQGVSKELAIKAEKTGNAIQLEIHQPVAAQPAGVSAAPDAPALKSPERAGAGTLKTEKEKLSYALGANLGSGIRRQSVDVDADLVVRGLEDALSGTGMLLTAHEVTAIVGVLQKELKSKQITSEAEKIVAAKQAAEKNKKDGEQFLAANKAKEGVTVLESGLQYKILKAGEGAKPTLDDTVACHYRGTLIDGTEFDSSYKRNQPATFPLRKVIKGWTEALQLMPVGSKWQLFIPSQLAYGQRGVKGGIPPNAALIFEVELLSIKDKTAAGMKVDSIKQEQDDRSVKAMKSRSTVKRAGQSSLQATAQGVSKELAIKAASG